MKTQVNFPRWSYFSDFLIIQRTERNGEDSRSPPTTYCFREHVPDSLESGTNLMKQPQAPARAHQRTWPPGPPRCPWASPRCRSRSTSAWPGGGRTSASSSFSWIGWRSRHPSCAASLAWGPPAWSGTTGTSRPWARTSGASRSSWGHLSPQGSGGREGFEESPSSWMLRSVGLKVQPILNFAPNVLPSDMPPTMDHSTAGSCSGGTGEGPHWLAWIISEAFLGLPGWSMGYCRRTQVQYLVRELRSGTPLDAAKKRNTIFPYFQRSSYSLSLEILVRSLTPRLQRDWYSNPEWGRTMGVGVEGWGEPFPCWWIVFLSRHPREGKLV